MELIFSKIGPDTRATVLHGIIDEFLGEGSDLPSGAAATIDGLMLSLVVRLGSSARAGLSERLAHTHAGLLRTVRAFALDGEACVSIPVLRHSPLLTEDDLVAVARVRGQAHLSAIAGRGFLSEAVSDLVVVRGEATVLRTLAGNRTARLSPRGLDGLAAAALGDERFTPAMMGRPDMPRRLAELLSQQIATGLRDFAASARDAGASLSGEAAIFPHGREDESAPEEASTGRPLSDDDVAVCVDEGRWSDAVLLIGTLSGQPAGIVADALASPDPGHLLLLMRLANLGTDVAEKILRARPGVERAGRGIADQKAAYLSLSRASAERGLRLLQLHTSVMDGPEAGAPAPQARRA